MAFVKNPYVIGIAISIACNFLTWLIVKLATKHKDELIKVAKVVQRIPDYLIDAESVLGAGKGDQKLKYALHLVQLICSTFNLCYEKYEAAFIGEIERMLATPQKHEHEIVENA